jgi:hypothetical protein
MDDSLSPETVESQEPPNATMKAADPWIQFSIAALVCISSLAYFLFSHGIRNHFAFLMEAAEKTLRALGAGA